MGAHTKIQNEAKCPIDQLPESARWEYVMYEVDVRQVIEQGWVAT